MVPDIRIPWQFWHSKVFAFLKAKSFTCTDKSGSETLSAISLTESRSEGDVAAALLSGIKGNSMWEVQQVQQVSQLLCRRRDKQVSKSLHPRISRLFILQHFGSFERRTFNCLQMRELPSAKNPNFLTAMTLNIEYYFTLVTNKTKCLENPGKITLLLEIDNTISFASISWCTHACTLPSVSR